MRWRLSFLSFGFKGDATTIEAEYKKVKATIMKSFFKTLLWLLIVLLALSAIIYYVASMASRAAIYTIAMIICIVVLRYGTRFERYMDYVLALMCFALILNNGLNLHKTLEATRDFTLFYSGYGIAAFERIVVFELTRIELKVLYTLAAFTVRFVLYRPPAMGTILGHLIYLFMFLYIDFRREKSDRALFQSFYDYREELVKFKNLMVSGLPTNILILTKNMKRKLFANEFFYTTFNLDANNRSWHPQEWLKLFTIEKDAIVDINQNDMSSDTTSSVDMQQFLNILKEKQLITGQGQQFNTRGRINNGGEDKIFGTRVFSLLWDGKEAVALVLNDMTQQYTNLSLKIANANKDKMIAMVSHELRTPLNGILGMIQIMEKQIVDETILTYLTVCKNSGKLLLSIVNSILDLGQIRNNKLKLNIIKTSLSELLNEVYYLFEFQFTKKGLYLKLDIHPNAPQFITTDDSRLKQILINLIGNAFKFTFEGGVTVSVDYDPEKEGFLEFKVSDTGIGIKEEEQKKLFKMYGKLEQRDYKVNAEGVGLGLTISDYLVKLLSGGIEEEGIKVESKYEEGTTLSFSVKQVLEKWLSNLNKPMLDKSKTAGNDTGNMVEPPRSPKEIDYSICSEDNREVSRRVSSHVLDTRFGRSPNSNRYGANDSASLQQQRSYYARIQSAHCSLQFGSIKEAPPVYSTSLKAITTEGEDETLLKDQPKSQVLLVDDSPFNIMVAKHLIESLGYQVKTALNGKLAVNMVQETAKSPNEKMFKVIFMDCQMPVMNGYEATKALKKMMGHGEIPEIPIIALSANDSEDDKKRCKDVGMVDHLAKPITEADLKEMIEKYLKRD